MKSVLERTVRSNWQLRSKSFISGLLSPKWPDVYKLFVWPLSSPKTPYFPISKNYEAFSFFTIWIVQLSKEVKFQLSMCAESALRIFRIQIFVKKSGSENNYNNSKSGEVMRFTLTAVNLITSPLFKTTNFWKPPFFRRIKTLQIRMYRKLALVTPCVLRHRNSWKN